jgi:hypothetical protein
MKRLILFVVIGALCVTGLHGCSSHTEATQSPPVTSQPNGSPKPDTSTAATTTTTTSSNPDTSGRRYGGEEGL